MPILHKLVAVCESCGGRRSYEAIVNHAGEAASDSYGSRDLTPRDVEHEPELPDGWRYVQYKLLCAICQRGSATEQGS